MALKRKQHVIWTEWWVKYFVSLFLTTFLKKDLLHNKFVLHIKQTFTDKAYTLAVLCSLSLFNVNYKFLYTERG